MKCLSIMSITEKVKGCKLYLEKLKVAQTERNDCIRLLEMMQQEGITFDKIIKNFRASDGSFIAPSLLREKVKRLEKFIRPESGKTRSFSILNNQGSQSLQAEQHRVEMLRRKQEREIQNLITFEMRVYIMTQV